MFKHELLEFRMFRCRTSNYGERYRYGETISTAFAESTINQVVSKRMVKKQQMRWSQKGAHLLLQVRTRVLNGELLDEFENRCQQFGLPGSRSFNLF